MARNRVTLQTIADKVGVSRATVSYAFSRPDQLSGELRLRILDAARELGYAGPDAAARTLRLGRARAVGLLFTETLPYALADPYAIGFLQGLATAVEEGEVGLLILPQPRGVERVEIVQGAVVDAFCVYSLPEGHAALQVVLARKLPTVVVNEPYLPGHPFLSIDERAAGMDAAHYLLDLGHRRTAAAVTGLHQDGRDGWADVARQESAVFSAMRGRVGGYRAAHLERGLDLPVYEVAANSRGSGRQAGHALLAMEPRPTAILCNTDVLALGVLEAAADLGLGVPGEVSVLGFSDSGAEEAALSTIRQPKQLIGETAGRMLLSGEALQPRRLTFPHELVVRRTTAPPPGV